MPETWRPQNVHEPEVPEFTDDEIRRYASYHWLQFVNDDGKVDAHIWRSIGGSCEYVGLADYHICGHRTPDKSLPMYPSLTPSEGATHFGHKSDEGGNLTKIKQEEVIG